MNLYIFSGLFIIVFMCIIPLTRRIQEFDVQKNGVLVTATITDIPRRSSAKSGPSMRFVYAGQEFRKTVRGGFTDDHQIGDTIRLKHKEGTDIFVFENENIRKEFIACALLMIFGIAVVIMGVKEKMS